MNTIIVTTADIDRPYDVLGPVYFQVSNKGFFGSALDSYVKKYKASLEKIKANGGTPEGTDNWAFIYGEWSVKQSNFEKAFYIATQELKNRASLLGADAIVGMRQDIDVDTNEFSYFYLQMYGTAIRFRD